jgi:hypothetical protein
MATSFTPLQPTLGIAHGDIRLVYGCPVPWKLTVLVLTLLLEAVWNLVVSVSTEDR